MCLCFVFFCRNLFLYSERKRVAHSLLSVAISLDSAKLVGSLYLNGFYLQYEGIYIKLQTVVKYAGELPHLVLFSCKELISKTATLKSFVAYNHLV